MQRVCKHYIYENITNKEQKQNNNKSKGNLQYLFYLHKLSLPDYKKRTVSLYNIIGF